MEGFVESYKNKRTTVRKLTPREMKYVQLNEIKLPRENY